MMLMPLTDKVVISALLVRDELYQTVCNIEQFTDKVLNLELQHWYALLDADKKTILGVFMVAPHIGRLVYFHGGIYKKYRNKNTKQLLRDCLEQVAPKTDCIFMTTISESNLPAQKLVESIGLEKKTVIAGGYGNSNLILYSEV